MYSMKLRYGYFVVYKNNDSSTVKHPVALVKVVRNCDVKT